MNSLYVPWCPSSNEPATDSEARLSHELKLEKKQLCARATKSEVMGIH